MRFPWMHTVWGNRGKYSSAVKELARLKEENVANFLDIVNDLHQGNAKARLVMDQVIS